jgi:HK97 family phage prohead protease
MQQTIRKQFISEISKDVLAGMSGRTRKFVISTSGVDRDNDTIDQSGWNLANYKANPVVLWAHDYSQLPIARAVDIHVEGNNLVAMAEFADHAFADTVLRLIDGGFLRATSVGFKPTKAVENVERGGYDFKAQELLEFSVVPVPANPQALITMGIDEQTDADLGVIRKWAAGWLKADKERVTVKAEAPDFNDSEDDPIRWNRSLTKTFDVDGEPLQAHKLEYTWVSRFLDTPVKDLYETTTQVGGAKVGSFLAALEDGLAGFKTASVRNFNYAGEKEVPPVYETMQLNSKLSRSFLVEGVRFMSGNLKMVLKVQPSWAGIALTGYIERGGADELCKFLNETHARAATYKFLKGEAFAVSGEFLQRDGTSWDDLVLGFTNIDPIQRTVKLLNEQGGEMEARGMILMGPPGTGKTLAGRVMMNEAKDTTFIWVSQRDMTRMGSFGGITQAFDLASENAPAIVLLEDVDNAISYQTDLLKTELDGLKKKKGVVTVLTTNFPEQLPKALIDRPGRFHDVLSLSLPDETIRRAMLAKWAPDATVETLDKLATDTLGMSGAHLRELVRFANVIRTQDGADLDDALTRAFDKVKEQREIIDAARAERVYRSVKALAADSPVLTQRTKVGELEVELSVGGDALERLERVAKALDKHLGSGEGTCSRCETVGGLCASLCAKCVTDVNAWDSESLLARVASFVKEAKAGRVLSRANESRVRQAKEMLDEVLTQLETAAEEEKDEAVVVLELSEPDDELVLELSGDAPTTGGDVFDVDPDQLRQLVVAAMAESISGAVRDATTSSLARLRGRVD